MVYSFQSVKVDYRISLVFIFAAFVFLYLFGIHGLLKLAPFGDDFSVFYKAGALFMQGENPWLELMNSRTPYSYPPHSLSLVAFYNLFPFSIALFIHTFINILSIIVICYCANKWFLKIQNYKDINIAQLLPLVLIVGNPYMATSIHQGQLALPAAAAVFLSWDFLKQGRWILAGMFLGLATIKPQLSVLYVAWLLFSFNFRTLLIGAALAFLLIIPGGLTFGFIEVFLSWLTSMGNYTKVLINAPGVPYVVGLESLFAAYGVGNTEYVFKPLALVAFVLLFMKRNSVDTALTVHLFFVIAFTFIYGHDYDYAAVIAVWSYCLFLCLSGTSLIKIALVFILMFFFFLPQRLIRDIDIPILLHMRTFLLLLCCWLVYIWRKNSFSSGRSFFINKTIVNGY